MYDMASLMELHFNIKLTKSSLILLLLYRYAFLFDGENEIASILGAATL